MVVKSLSATTGVPESVLRLLFTILLSYPLALFYRFTFLRPLKTIWAPFLRNLYVVVTGLALCYYHNGSDIKHSLIATIVTWIFCLIGDIVGNRTLSAISAFLFNIIYLTVGYYKVQNGDYGINWTMTQCVLCLRMIGFAMDFMDGEKLKKSKLSMASTHAKNSISSSPQKVGISTSRPQKQPISFEKNIQLLDLPPLIETIGYAYFFGSFLIGPQFSFHLYRKFLTMTLFPDATRIPSGSYKSAMKSLFLGALYLGVYEIGSGYFPASYLITADFASKPFINRLMIMWWVGKFSLTKYLGIWTLAEGASMLSGISFNGYDDHGNAEWNGLANVDRWRFEFATSLADIVGSFNTNTNLWVKTYVFKRFAFLGNKELSSIISLLFLALWHGVCFGYYFCFSLEFFDVEIERRWAKRVESYTKPLYLPQNKNNPSIQFWRRIHQLVGWLGQTCALHYAVVSFVLLKWEYIRIVYNSVHWIGHITVFSLLLLDFILPKHKKTSEVNNKMINGDNKMVNGDNKMINGDIRNSSKKIN
ncbi:MBOAT-domain-containing protein [Gigaspora margarita]|uniref:Lysophospholipid acyltransferase 5 n=1 Tax=Gigaspora margarita TaxID=4874 RepID=A0A8H4A420_GIGMA|nr:MBOAT-domain-containing protein [Gigaspora margarita]